MVKPHIRLDGGVWRCGVPCADECGYGGNMLEAYRGWTLSLMDRESDELDAAWRRSVWVLIPQGSGVLH